MRATLIILNALLALVLAFYLAAGGRPALRDAHGQAAVTPEGALQVLQGPGGDAFAVLYDPESKHLAAYLITREGLKLRGVREVTYDLKLQEVGSLPPQGMSVKDVKALVK